MTRFLEVLRQRVVDLLRELHDSPRSLFCILFAANAIALPYQGIYHDSKIYAFQVLNRVYQNRFSEDLFFQYGSQDRYSLFSRVAAPTVAALGLPIGFFLLYVLSNGVLIVALLRFVRALVKDPVLSTVTLLLLVVTPIPFAGLYTFHVNETFLTPRIQANALVLFALERLLAGRPIQTGILILAALSLHPLIAFPGLLVILGWIALTYFSKKQIVIVLIVSSLTAVVVLFDTPLGVRLFGYMDDAWRDIVSRTNVINYPLKWSGRDWSRIALSFGLALIGAWSPWYDARVRRLFVLISIVAGLGLAVGVLACFLPYALLLQGQSYRWLWPLELIRFPLGVLAAHRLWLRGYTLARLASLSLLISLNDTPLHIPILLCFFTITALIGVIYWRGLAKRPREEDWIVRAAVAALAAGILLWTTYKIGLVIVLRAQILPVLEPHQYLSLLIAMIDPLCRLAATIFAVLLLKRFLGFGLSLRLASLTACLGSYAVFFVLPQSRLYSENLSRYGRDKGFIADYLEQHPIHGKTPTIYWPCGAIEITWLELRANSYFEWPSQIAGNIFNSGTALEGERRLQIVKKFEMARMQQEKILYREDTVSRVKEIYHATEPEPLPEVDDLWTLCREKQLDLVVLPQEFPGLFAASNGQWFIYDCRALRARLNASPSNSFTPTP